MTADTNPLHSQVIDVPNGQLGFAEFGAPHGSHVMYFHGCPASRMQGVLGDDSARSLGIRLIAPDRPGMGLSIFDPHRTISGWADTVQRLADHLGWETFSILAISGGAPYALACARFVPDRLSSILICSGVPCPNWLKRSRESLWLLRAAAPFWAHTPWLLSPVLALGRWRSQQSQTNVLPNWLLRPLPPTDRAIARDASVMGSMRASLREALCQSNRGIIQDAQLLAADWGFDPREIELPITYWHGGADVICPLSTVKDELGLRPNASLRVFPEEGHYSLAIAHTRALLATLLSLAEA